MKFIGNEKQEKKIEEMGSLAAEMMPNMTKNAFKGAFRWGVDAALSEHGLAEWREAAAKHAQFRRMFFKSIMENSVPRLKGLGLAADEIESVKARLIRANEKYLTD